ncbi:MAG: hypothetical protein ABFC96_03070 [Thermoguttaceae bacterium]
MFLIRFFAWLVSLPILWAGQLAALVKLPITGSLLEAAWWVGGDGRVAVAALAVRQQRESPEAIRQLVSEWLTRRPHPQIAVSAGFLAVEASDFDWARQMVALARELGDEKEGRLDLLEGLIVIKSDEGAEALMSRWKSRRDLPPAASAFVHQWLLWNAMMAGRWPEVERRAKHLRSIQTDQATVAAFWALDWQRGKRRDLDDAFRQAKILPERVLDSRAMAYAAVGAVEESRRAIDAIRQIDPALAERTEKILQRRMGEVT